MATLEETLLAQNPWWTQAGPKSLTKDPHLRRLESSAVRWNPPVLDAMSLTFGDTHTLRGPRQVGKTTTLKRLVQRLVTAGEQRIFYFAFDYATSPEFIEQVIRTAKELYQGPQGPWYLLLDEITAVPEWQRGVKVAWDTGLTSEDAIVLTASSAHDLKRGAERLPGRRGRGGDYLQLPMSFRDYCIAAHGIVFPDAPIFAEEFLMPQGQGLVRRLLGMQTTLARAFADYLKIGGFPAAVNDTLQTGTTTVSPAVVQMLWDSLAGDVTKAGREPMAALRLLQTIGTSLGSMLSWLSASRAMGFEKPDTARQYAEQLAEVFAVLTVYYWDISTHRLEPRKQRKLYWLDPLIGAIPEMLIPGTSSPSPDGLIENAVAVSLFRSAAQTLIQANAVPGSIAYWRSSNDREIDFVIPQMSDLAGARFPIEVKGDAAAGLAGARRAIRLAYTRGLVLSRTVFDWQPDVAVIPVWAFLAGLREQPFRAVTLG